MADSKAWRMVKRIWCWVVGHAWAWQYFGPRNTWNHGPCCRCGAAQKGGR